MTVIEDGFEKLHITWVQLFKDNPGYDHIQSELTKLESELSLIFKDDEIAQVQLQRTILDKLRIAGWMNQINPDEYLELYSRRRELGYKHAAMFWCITYNTINYCLAEKEKYHSAFIEMLNYAESHIQNTIKLEIQPYYENLSDKELKDYLECCKQSLLELVEFRKEFKL